MEAIKLLERGKSIPETIHLGPANTGTNEQTYIEVAVRWVWGWVFFNQMRVHICLVCQFLEVGVISASVTAVTNMWKMQVEETTPVPQRLKRLSIVQ